MSLPEEIYSSFLLLGLNMFSLAKRFHGKGSPVSKDISVFRILHSAAKSMRENLSSGSEDLGSVLAVHRACLLVQSNLTASPLSPSCGKSLIRSSCRSCLQHYAPPSSCT